MYTPKERRRMLFGVAALIAAAGVMRAFLGSPAKPEPSASGYYAGPMKAKGGTTYGTEDGRQVAAPTEMPGEAIASAPRPERTNQ
jgi:hypothetical protein